jgi:hypothetical protein
MFDSSVRYGRKASRLLERGFSPGKNMGKFRHFRGYQMRNKRFEGIYNGQLNSIISSKIVPAIEASLTRNGLPQDMEEIQEVCQETYDGMTNKYAPPTVSLKKIIKLLPDYLISHINSLDEYTTEPFFTRVLSEEQIKKSLCMVNNTKSDQKPAIISALEQACKEGLPIEKVMEEKMGSDDMKAFAAAREIFCPL